MNDFIAASQKPGFNRPDAWIVVLLISAQLGLQLLLYTSGFQSLTADEFGRMVVAAKWANAPFPVLSGPWLPFHTYFYGPLIHLFGDMLWLPRATAVVFGAVSIALMYLLAHQLFKSRLIAMLSAIVLVINPAHIWLSSVPLTEIIQTTLICAFAWLYVQWLENQRASKLLAGALCLGLATTVRFESWLFGVLFSILLVANLIQQHRKHSVKTPGYIALIAYVLVWSFPLYWLIGNLMQTGDPFGFLELNRQFDFRWYGETQNYGEYLGVFFQIDPIATLLTVPAIIAVAIHRQRNTSVMQYTLLVIGTLALYIILRQGYVQPRGNYIRYLAVFQFMLYPLIAWFIWLLSRQFLPNSQGRLAGFSIIVLLLAAVQLRTAFNYAKDPSSDGLRVGQALKEVRSAQPAHPANALLELNHFQYLATHVGANDMKQIIYDRPLNLAELNNTPSSLTPTVLHDCNQKYQFGYAIARDSKLKTMIEDTFAVSVVSTLDNYTLYKITPLQENANADACPLKVGTGY